MKNFIEEFIFGPGISYTKNGINHTTFAVAYKPEQYEIRDRMSYPYSYSPIIIFGEENKDDDGCQYSDRLYQQDYDLTQKLCVKHFGNIGQHFNNRDPKLIEKFLRERLNRPKLKLTMIVEWCNASNGYPYWSFHFKR